MVIARYPDAGAMEEATATAQQALGQLVVAGVIDGSSIEQWRVKWESRFNFFFKGESFLFCVGWIPEI
ncbi:MAG: hypothetical protein CM1200mP41_33520 [Gammaproteobacteria bacterium]|nr:MAG: hypothetical protein CM1200mP41_33520 [Gammaproteobacteria bacterium]